MKIMLDGMYATGGATLSLDTTHTGLSGGACFSPLSRERAGFGSVTVPEWAGVSRLSPFGRGRVRFPRRGPRAAAGRRGASAPGPRGALPN